jgi:hydroxyacylglutathione hydrolase
MTGEEIMIEVEQFPCLSDNYGYLIHDTKSGLTAAIDTPESAAILAALARRGWSLDYIWNTHHHFDHAGNNLELKEKTGCKIIGPKGEADRIPGIDEAVDDGDIVSLGDAEARVLNVGGHTLGHIAFYFAEDEKAFVGDTIFALGCGRIFEGTAEQMWASLQKIAALPATTTLYCAHEYTAANARFACHIDGQNQALKDRAKDIDIARSKDIPTVPTRLSTELETNPFLRPHDPKIRDFLNMADARDVDVFAEIRRQKDIF